MFLVTLLVTPIKYPVSSVTMTRITKPLTNTEIKQAKAKTKEYNLSDGGGLMLRIRPTGSKLWLLNYYHPLTKKRKNISFGLYPEVTLAQARAKREDARSLLADSIDPKSHKQAAHQSALSAHNCTLEHIARKWFDVKKASISSDYADDVLRSLTLHIFPALGKCPIDKLTAVQTIECLKPIASKGSLETVKRLCQRLNEIMTFAVNTGLTSTNPLSGIKAAFQSPVSKNMPTIEPQQLPKLMASVSIAQIKITTRCLLEWQLHTMVRPSEAAGTQWDEIDFKNRLWNIPSHRMKKKREHVVPLSNESIALLEFMRSISGNRVHVFPGDRNPTSHMNSQSVSVALIRMGYKNILVAHGFRSIASTAMNEQLFNSDMIEACLAHVDANTVRRAYNRADYIEQRRELMQWWSNFISKAAGNNTITASMNILNLQES